jgi:hypothetical protein
MSLFRKVLLGIALLGSVSGSVLTTPTVAKAGEYTVNPDGDPRVPPGYNYFRSQHTRFDAIEDAIKYSRGRPYMVLQNPDGSWAEYYFG